ncbi:MAG: hypothetical protein ABI629_16320 [bacterium]
MTKLSDIARAEKLAGICTPSCPTCDQPLFATGDIEPAAPRRRWVCEALHSVWRDDTEPLPAPAGQIGLL